MKPATALPPILVLLALASAAQAQGIQRIVGPDGRVTYTDGVSAPASASSSATAATPVPAATASADGGVAALPYALRQAAQRYPVTLYSGEDCAPCASARNLLQQRGVPFAEKTVTTDDDRRAFSRLGVERVLPLVTVGRQRLSGFDAVELARYLDAAGYPAQSQLPRHHRNPPAQALAQPAPAARDAAAEAEPPTAPAPASVPVAPSPANPAGIRF